MHALNRRDFLKAFGATASLALMPAALRAQTGQRVVVVGGGFGGATVAKFQSLWDPGLEVVLVEPNPNYISCVMSNLVLHGRLNMADITLSYAGLTGNHGVLLVPQMVDAVDADAHSVHLANGDSLGYDKLVLAPGIGFIYPDGLQTPQAQALVPHAWKAGPQTQQLRDALLRMRNGGRFVMTIPTPPYRCPAGPYERACQVAQFFREKKPRSKVIVLDANPQIIAERHIFEAAFAGPFAGIVEYHPNSPVLSVNASQRSVTTVGGTFRGDVLNVIPLMQAGKILFDAGLINVDNRWAGVDLKTFASNVPGVEDVFVIGDSHGSGLPKSGHLANAEAKVVASAIIAQLGGLPVNAAPVLNNTCYSAVTNSTGSWVAGVYAYDANDEQMKAVPGSLGESPRAISDDYDRMFGWARNLWADSLG